MMSRLFHILIAIALFAAPNGVSAKTVYAHWALKSPAEATDLQFEFFDVEGVSIRFLKRSPFEAALYDSTKQQISFTMIGNKKLSEGTDVIVAFELTDDKEIFYLVVAWWTKEKGTRYGPKIDLTFARFDDKLPENPWIVPNIVPEHDPSKVPIPMSLPMLSLAAWLIYFGTSRKGTSRFI